MNVLDLLKKQQRKRGENKLLNIRKFLKKLKKVLT